ncbi:molybdenum cofactor guanylyltransferase [Natrarchaeobaculum aegyptiacum]|uniref:Molybdenum cofactor guanylyltransferase n=1 Tax=Natrarchaeobaculum aegyptiacum TaxID=745377 RepID=A0A2Z2HNC4_9EURY|nr:molybdenum cofactor guanylyltransferase [Natrarchaeobaculum aegyptiacum]ARS88399.1 molybdenum cofactor guanylyltransferase [Natrarchaeobaculum aegyptiacum]
MVTGAIIAGGRSTRFGEADKAVAPLAGTPMIRRVANRLAGTAASVDPGGDAASDGDPVVDNLLVNCRADQRAAIEAAMGRYPLEVRYVEDDEPDLGPMAGIRHACRGAPDDLVAVVACDMPFVDPSLLEYLCERAADAEAAVPQLNDEWFQTTQAVYRAEPMADACDRALARGDRRIIEPLFDLEYVVVDHDALESVTSERTFENVNTREELDRAARRYRDVA